MRVCQLISQSDICQQTTPSLADVWQKSLASNAVFTSFSVMSLLVHISCIIFSPWAADDSPWFALICFYWEADYCCAAIKTVFLSQHVKVWKASSLHLEALDLSSGSLTSQLCDLSAVTQTLWVPSLPLHRKQDSWPSKRLKWDHLSKNTMGNMKCYTIVNTSNSELSYTKQKCKADIAQFDRDKQYMPQKSWGIIPEY